MRRISLTGGIVVLLIVLGAIANLQGSYHVSAQSAHPTAALAPEKEEELRNAGEIPAAALGSFKPSPSATWHDFFCINGESCQIGDFNGDGRDDIVTFIRDTKPGVGVGDVFVALSNGRSFGPGKVWHPTFCVGGEICKVGDFDGDGRDDVAAFMRDGPVRIALSYGSKFANNAIWDNLICLDDDICEIGDFNGDGKDDIVKFVRTALGCNPNCDGTDVGEVLVFLSTGSGFRLKGSGGWHPFFCLPSEVCAVGDFDGDRKDDMVTFIRDTKDGAGRGDVVVALSTGSRFLPQPVAPVWHPFFCIGREVCAVGDFDGDSQDDIAAFIRDTKNGAGRGDVVVALSTSSRFVPQPVAPVWHPFFCVGREVCAVGDFNGDSQDDIVAFVRDTKADPERGNVYVALSERVDRVFLPFLSR